MAAKTDEDRKELLRIWDAQEKELAEFHGDVGDYLNEDVLEIKREQYLSEGKWTTSKYTLVTGTGGPHVEFDSNHRISVFWAGDSWEAVTYDAQAVATIDEIGAWLDEIYPK
jgi:hypothetical protein